MLILTIASVIYGNYRKNQCEKSSGLKASLVDHILMGRRLSLPFFVATLVATWYGGIFGVTEIAFKHGIYNFITQGVFWYITYIIFAFYFVKLIRRYKALTLAELVGQLYGPRSEFLAGLFNFFNVVPIAYTISLGLFLQALFGIDFTLGMLIGMLFVCFYSTFGGFRSVVYSDIIQFSVMCMAVILVVFFAYSQFGGIGYLKANLPASHFEITGGQSVSTLIVWGLIALSTLVDPNFYHRVFAAASDGIAKRGILISTAVWCVFDLCTTLGGMYAMATIPGAEPGNAYLTFATQVLPPGIRGFFLAGILATILSTMDSYLFIAANTLAYDMLPKKFRGRLWINKLAVFCIGFLAFYLALSFEGSIKNVWKTFGSYSAGCLLLPLTVGMLKPGIISDKGFYLSSLLGVAGISYWRLSERTGVWKDIDDLYIGLLLSGTGLIIAGLSGRLKAA